MSFFFFIKSNNQSQSDPKLGEELEGGREGKGGEKSKGGKEREGRKNRKGNGDWEWIQRRMFFFFLGGKGDWEWIRRGECFFFRW